MFVGLMLLRAVRDKVKCQVILKTMKMTSRRPSPSQARVDGVFGPRQSIIFATSEKITATHGTIVVYTYS